MDEESGDDLWYPSVADVLTVHEDIQAEDPDATPGVADESRIEHALDRIEHGYFGEVPETIHEKAFQLMRLLATNHWFVDGNKRTALNTTWLFYPVNGYDFDYGDDIRAMLKLLSVREALIAERAAIEYFSDIARRDDEPRNLEPIRRGLALLNIEGIDVSSLSNYELVKITDAIDELVNDGRSGSQTLE
jgi:death-on-curing protein